MRRSSRERLSKCHPDIIRLAIAVNNVLPIHCICGARNKEEQDKAYKDGKSKVPWPNSKHNISPEAGRKVSHAADFVPGDGRVIDWDNTKAFEVMCLVFEQKADELGIKIKLGRDFSFQDFPHIELVS